MGQDESVVRTEEIQGGADPHWWKVVFIYYAWGPSKMLKGRSWLGTGKSTPGPHRVLWAFLKSRIVKDIKERGGWESAHMQRLGRAREWIGGRLTLSHCLELSAASKRAGEYMFT